MHQKSIGPQSGETNTNILKFEKTSCSKKNMKCTTVKVRRSPRILNTPRHVDNGEIQPVPEEINLSAGDEDQPSIEEENKSLEEQQNATLGSSGDGISGGVDNNYKRMYIASQKKVQDLLDTNNELCKKLENALGKLEAYEKGDKIFSDIWTVLSSLSKTVEMAVAISAEAVRGSSFQKAEEIAPRTYERTFKRRCPDNSAL